MSIGAVTLQCPSCGGVFLTLQQSGVVEICPHCAVSSARSNYFQTNVVVGAAAKTELPSKREAVTPVLPDVFFPHTPAKSGHYVDKAPAPSPPVALPMPAPAAVEARAVAAPPTSPPTTDDTSSKPVPDPSPLANASVQPFGIDPPLTSVGPRARKPGLGVVCFLMLSCLSGAVIWMATRKPDAAVVSRTESLPPPTAWQKPVVPQPEVAPKTEAKPKDEIVLRARADDVHMANLAESMAKGLDAATTTDERLRFIDQPENYRADVERFFASKGGKLDLVRIEPSVGMIIVLPSGDEEKLFKLTTKKCPDGAIIRTILKDDKAVLHWPLFEQSHDYLFDRYKKETGGTDTPSVWFTVICRLTQAFDLKGPSKDNWICLEAQGSLAAGGTGQVYVAKDTPAGRLLTAKMTWGRVYLTDLLIGNMELDGQKVHVVLDCAGTQPAGRPVR